MKNYSDDLKFLALTAGRFFLALNFKLVEFVKYLFFLNLMLVICILINDYAIVGNIGT